jgi:hypothetical protein
VSAIPWVQASERLVGANGDYSDVLNRPLQQVLGDSGSDPALAFSGFAALHNVKATKYGAKGDDATNDTVAVQAALTAANAGGGGWVYFPAGRYKYTNLDLSGFQNVTILGQGTGAPDAASVSALITTVTGAGTAISLASAQGIVFRGIRLYAAAGFTGTLVKTGWSALNRDPSHLRFENVAFAAGGVLLDLEKSILVTVDQCAFRGGTRAIIGHQGTYSNVVRIVGSEFSSQTSAPILQPGESWTIEGNAFEGILVGGVTKAGAVDLSGAGTYFNYGLNFRGNWFGDVTASGGVWVNVRPLGGVIAGNFGQVEGTDTFCKLRGGSVGVHVTANRITQGSAGAIGLDFESSVDGPIVEGNDFQCDVPIQNDLANTVGGRIQDNHNVTYPRVLAANSATPAVGSARTVVTNNSAPTTITNFLNGRDGQHIFILVGTNDTIQHNGTIHTSGAANIAGAAGMVVGLLRIGSTWQEVSRVTAT